jgi:hypothetical protein
MHNNLHPQILHNIEQSERDGGLCFDQLQPGDVVRFQTRNTLYTLQVLAEGATLQGHCGYCPIPTQFRVHGSTWGGSMLKIGFIGVGMHLEGSFGPKQTITTTAIQWIELNGKRLVPQQGNSSH